MGIHHMKLGLKSFACASQFTIPDMAGTTPDPGGNNTDKKSSTPNQVSRTPDLSYPLVSSILFTSSSLISLSRPELYHHCRTTFSHISLSRHAMMMSKHREQHTPSTAYTMFSIHTRVSVFPSFSRLRVDP